MRISRSLTRSCTPPRKQRGVALVVAIMILALVTVLSVEIYWHFNLGLSRHASRVGGVQGRAYLDALEDFARYMLKVDMQENKVDTLNEMWAQQQPPFETDLGYVGGYLRDAQARFNINSLQNKVENPNNNFATDWHKRYTPAQRRFIRLLQTLQIEEGTLVDQSTAEAICDAVIDWLDPDSEPTGFGGAEGDHYSRLEPPMTIANREMASISELSLVKGVTPELYQALLPLVIALPKDVPMNINTVQTPLLRMLNGRNMPQPLSLEDAQLLLDARGVEGFENIEDFLGYPDVVAMFDLDNPDAGNQNSSVGFDSDGLSTQSSFFIFVGETLVGEHMQYSKSMLMRTDQDVVTIRRTDANF